MNELDLGKVVGSQMHNVTAAPADSLGLEGDWAVNPDTGDVYEKTASGWTLQGSFKGPKGDTGETGAQGPAGADGKTPSFSIREDGHLIATYSE